MRKWTVTISITKGMRKNNGLHRKDLNNRQILDSSGATFSPPGGTTFSSRRVSFPCSWQWHEVVSNNIWVLTVGKKINPVMAETKTSIKTQWSHYIMMKSVSFFVIIICVSSKQRLTSSRDLSFKLQPFSIIFSRAFGSPKGHKDHACPLEPVSRKHEQNRMVPKIKVHSRSLLAPSWDHCLKGNIPGGHL